MYLSKLFYFITTLLLLTITLSTAGDSDKTSPANKERDSIPDQFKWDITHLYKSVDKWEEHKNSFYDKFEKAATFKGSLAKSAKNLLEALDYIHQIDRDFLEVWIYASMLSDQDTRQSKPMAMIEEVRQMWTKFTSNTSYVDPEILAIPAEKLETFFKEEPKLKIYNRYIENIQRMKPYTLTDKEENCIAQAGRMAGIASGVHNVLSNADLPYPVVKFSDGNEVSVNVPMYSKYRGSKNREDRIKAFNAFYTALKDYRRTYAALLNGKIKENLFYKEIRGYSSVLDMAMFRRNVPTEVYTNLIKNNHKYLSYLQRYLKIRKKLLGVDELHYYDFYAEMVEGVEIPFTFEEAKDILKKSLKVLGDEYVVKLDEAFTNRWIDAYPNTGKASGAYCESSYDTHPYVFLNYNNRFPDMSMLAHELGHAMHSYFSNKTQPYATSNYATFVAEVASTTNEALLADYVLNTINDPKKKLALLGSYLEACRQTLFRQTLFAEYEMIINQKAEQGESLTDEDFSRIYLDLLKKYYGHDEGVCVIDDLYGNEWAYISHFFLGYYNFTYSTSYTAAEALAEKMLTGGPEMVKKYIYFLSSGNSDEPIVLLKNLGLDMTTDEPFDLAMEKMKRVMDEMEEIMANMK